MDSEKFSNVIVNALEKLKARDLVRLDVRKLTTVTDFMIVASGTSNRHVKAIADAVIEASREAGVRPTGIEGEDSSEWILVDLGDTLVHVMQPHIREFYNLEKLWSLAPASDAVARDG